MRGAGKMHISVHCKVNNTLEVSLYSRQGEDVFQLVRSKPQLQDYLQDSAGDEVPLVPDTKSQPLPEVGKFVECKVASWLQGVDSRVGGEVFDAEVKFFFSFFQLLNEAGC